MSRAGVMLRGQPGAVLDRDAFSARVMLGLLALAAGYYLTTQAAWLLCFPDSKVSLFFPPHAVLVAVLLLVPRRLWWSCALAAAAAHFLATQQAGWPALYALQCEAFDVAKAVLTAAGIRYFTSTPMQRISLRDAVVFVLVAVALVPALAALWGAAFTVANRYGEDYWIEWLNLTVSNGVTVIVLVPAILLAAHALRARTFHPSPARILEGGMLAACSLAVGYFAFVRSASGPETSPSLLYAPVPLLVWAVLRFGLGGMCASMLLVTVLSIWGTMQGRGPFLTQAPAQNALELQLFLLMASTPLLLLAAAIGEERRSKEAMLASEERMKLAVESAQLGVWDWDASDDRVWMSAEGRRFFGLAPDDELHFADLVERVHPDDRDLRIAAIRQALRSGGSYEVEYRILQPDGSVRWIAARGRNQATSGDASPRILGVSMDITRQKQSAEEAQVQRRELAHLSRVATLGALSGSLAHELSQPLTSILSNAQAGQRFIAKPSPDLGEVSEILANIVEQDRRAGEIIHRLRGMLRRGEVSLQPVDVGEALLELLALVRSDLAARRVSVVNDAGAGLPRAMTDRVQLQQVLLNLIVNASDAMASSPPAQRELAITIAVEGAELLVGVLDRGSGLPEDIESAFEPFHTTKADGLGMGLSICRTLVTAQHGRLWAEHRPGGGAAFYVALPLAPA